jgi:hypothetical protein
VTVNPTLGTLLIAEAPGGQKEAVSETHRALDQFAGKVNRAIQSVTGETVNLKELFPFSRLLYAVFFVDRAVNAARWLNWLQFANKVGQSVEALRAEINAMHADLRQLASRLEG